MKDLKSLLQHSGYSDVSTYLHSGNVVFSLDINEENLEIEKKIEEIVEKHYNFNVKIFVLKKQEYQKIVEENPFQNDIDFEISRSYLTMLKTKPTNEHISMLNKIKNNGDKVTIGKKCLYIMFDTKISDSKLNNNSIEKALKTDATTRNWKTSKKIIDLL